MKKNAVYAVVQLPMENSDFCKILKAYKTEILARDHLVRLLRIVKSQGIKPLWLKRDVWFVDGKVYRVKQITVNHK